MHKKVAFFKEAVKSFKTSGTFIPSSRFLVKRILKTIDFSTSDVVVEYGAGNGIITKEILKRLKPNAVLICFEINEKFVEELQNIDNEQLVIISSSAENIHDEIEKLGYQQVDNFVSSLPLAIIPKEISLSIVQNSCKVLKNGGKFLQYQYSTQFLKQLKSIFNDNVKLEFEPLNLPPAFLYICKKK